MIFKLPVRNVPNLAQVSYEREKVNKPQDSSSGALRESSNEPHDLHHDSIVCFMQSLLLCCYCYCWFTSCFAPSVYSYFLPF